VSAPTSLRQNVAPVRRRRRPVRWRRVSGAQRRTRRTGDRDRDPRGRVPARTAARGRVPQERGPRGSVVREQASLDDAADTWRIRRCQAQRSHFVEAISSHGRLGTAQSAMRRAPSTARAYRPARRVRRSSERRARSPARPARASRNLDRRRRGTPGHVEIPSVGLSPTEP
jgi:hypothetical protein